MARPQTAARRYAEAAFEVAQRDGSLDDWRDDLQLSAQLVADERVARVVDNPARSLVERDALLRRLVGGRVAPPVENLVRLLAQRGRVELLPRIAVEYQRLLNRDRGVIEATVTSAVPLSQAESKAVRARVEEMTGASVELDEVIDESLIGGLTVRVGDRLLDASVRGRLERLRDQLVAGAR